MKKILVNRRSAISLIAAGMSGCLMMNPSFVHAFLYHAARKAAARRILQRGVNPAFFRTKARFGKGFYSSRRPATAIAEKGRRSTVVRMKESALLKSKKALDLRNPTHRKLRKLVGRRYNLKGSVKKRIIGPKIGRRLGTMAGKRGKVIHYRSIRTGGTNVFIPKKLLKRYPRVVRPEKIMQKKIYTKKR